MRVGTGAYSIKKYMGTHEFAVEWPLTYPELLQILQKGPNGEGQIHLILSTHNEAATETHLQDEFDKAVEAEEAEIAAAAAAAEAEAEAEAEAAAAAKKKGGGKAKAKVTQTPIAPAGQKYKVTTAMIRKGAFKSVKKAPPIVKTEKATPGNTPSSKRNADGGTSPAKRLRLSLHQARARNVSPTRLLQR